MPISILEGEHLTALFESFLEDDIPASISVPQ